MSRGVTLHTDLSSGPRIHPAHAERAPDAPACGKTFVAPFEGALSFRTAYRSSGRAPFLFCPQWSVFGPVRGPHRNHWGVDLSAPTGTPVRAAVDGTLTYAREPGGYGFYARLRFSTATRARNGACAGSDDYEILYAHLIDDGKTSTSPRTVRAGEIIGRVGCTGNARGMCSPSPESHLHVTVQRTGNRAKVEPASFLGWHVGTPSEHPNEWGVCGRK